jgi:hypothetical protein
MRETIPLRHRWGIGRHLLGGITHDAWLRLRRDNDIDAEFRGRAALLGLLSRVNSYAARREERVYGDEIAQTTIAEDPVFLLGHWRSGTTYLHHLLSLDPRFAFVTTVQAIHPATSLVTSPLFTRRANHKRPMDNVVQGPGTAQEDEFAVASLSLCSPFVGFVFPRRAEHYDRFLTFDDTTLDDTLAWKAAVLRTARKATLIAGGRRLVLKSPPHTARIRLILELFPHAKFVHLHRNPVDVLRSTLGLNRNLAWYSYLQRPNEAALQNDAFRRYRLMHEAYFRDERLVPAGNLIELSYRELTENPMAACGQIYRALGLADFEVFAPRLALYLRNQPKYEPPPREPIAAELKTRIGRVAEPSIARWDYRDEA